MSNLNLNPIAVRSNVGDVAGVTDRAPAAGSTDTRMEIEATRGRQTERPPAPFRSVLAGGISLLMTGAEAATHVVGGPVLAAAVHDARVSTAGAIAGSATTVMPGGTQPAAAVAAAAGATGNSEVGGIESLMQQGQASNLQLLALQEQVQQENQRFTTVSNVMRAKHDTAKAAVSNIRA
jgi:hypothetical protein